MVAPRLLELSYHSDDESSFCVAEQQGAAKQDADIPAAPQCDDDRPKRSVHFNDRVKVHAIPHWRQYSVQERHSMYISPEEKEQSKWELKNTLKRAIRARSVQRNKTPTKVANAKRHLQDDDEDPLDTDEMRGLEMYVPAAQRERKERIGRIVQAVLREQRMWGSVSEHWLIYVYQDMTAPSVWAAHLRGIMDQQIHLAAPPPVQMMIR